MIAREPHKEFWTLAELAQIAKTRGIEQFPQSLAGVQKYAASSGWNEVGADQRRKRAGRGGGWEYHWTLMPNALRTFLTAATESRALTSSHDVADLERRQLIALKASQLGPRAREAMEARAEILSAIEGYGLAQGQTRAWTIKRFLAAVDAHAERRLIEERRDAGKALNADQAASLAAPCLLTGSAGFGIDPERLAQANDRRRGGVKRATIYGWFKARDGGGAAALAPTKTKEAAPLPKGFARFLKFYALPGKPTASRAYEKFLDSNPPANERMSLSIVRRILRERLNNVEKHVGREGLLTLRARLPYVTRTTEDMWPTTIYTADGKTFDAEIADPVTHRAIRPEITTVLDVVTRKVVGIALSRKENRIAVTEALRRSSVDHGVPAIFYVDRGPGYKNKTFDADVGGLMGRLGVTKMHALPYGSQAKGRIERPQGTIWNTLAKDLPTYIGAEMDKEAAQKVHKLTRREIREFGQSRHLPAWDDFVAMCEAEVAKYNAKPHRGLPRFEDPETGRIRHMSPDECWAAHAADGFEPVEVAADEIDDLFRPYEIRTVRRGQVEWRTNSYFDLALEPYHQMQVMVGYDYHQADRVWVREFDVHSGQPGPLICVARFMANAQRYVPRSFEEEAIEKRADARVRRLEDKKAAAEAERDGIRLLDDEEPEADIFTLPETAFDLAPAEPAAPSEPRAANGRRTFASDEDLAIWALDHPNELSRNQIGLLQDCLARPAAREAFRASGIDTEALRTLLRAAA